MAHATDQVFADIDQKVSEKIREANDLKRAANQLAAVYGLSPIYEIDVDPSVTQRGRSIPLRPDEFFNQPFAKAVRSILERRREAAGGAGGTASPDELYADLVTGGFKFQSTGEANALQALKISLAKNSSTFVRLPNGSFGLAAWYNIRPRRETEGKGLPPPLDEADTSDKASATESEEEIPKDP